MQNAAQQQAIGFMQGIVDTLMKQADVMGRQIDLMKRMDGLAG